MVMDELKNALDVHNEAKHDSGLESDLARQRSQQSPYKLGRIGNGNHSLKLDENRPVVDGSNIDAVAHPDKEQRHKKLRHQRLRLLHEGGAERRPARDDEPEQQRPEDGSRADEARHEGHEQDAEHHGNDVELLDGLPLGRPPDDGVHGASEDGEAEEHERHEGEEPHDGVAHCLLPEGDGEPQHDPVDEIVEDRRRHGELAELGVEEIEFFERVSEDGEEGEAEGERDVEHEWPAEEDPGQLADDEGEEEAGGGDEGGEEAEEADPP